MEQVARRRQQGIRRAAGNRAQIKIPTRPNATQQYRNLMQRTGLPIEESLPDLLQSLRATSAAVLVAPPGAGKTTVVPLALAREKWCANQRIIMLEPRRLAAHAAATRMAELTQTRVGEQIGIRARFGTRVSADTRIEVMTDGVFTRIALEDPMLEGIAAVIFDEFHERSLDCDFGFALARDIQTGLRPDLRILVMSATLDGARISALMDDAPVHESEGRMFPVDTRYLGRSAHHRIEDAMVDAVRQALSETEGAVLAFLPGQGEIRRTQQRLAEILPQDRTCVRPLYGGLAAQEQFLALAPAPKGQRKIVLATAIAETSLTIPDVRVVIDSGLARVPRYDPGARMVRLETHRVSRAAADQRRGRAGRLAAGVCYRLWNAPETRSLRPFDTPEVETANLAGVVLDCAAWGVLEPTTLAWLDPPPRAAVSTARQELQALNALDAQGQVTPEGEALRALPLPPHLALMLIRAAKSNQEEDAAAIAAVLVERGVGGRSIDLEERIRSFAHAKSERARNMRAVMRRWIKTARQISAAHVAPPHVAEQAPSTIAGLLAIAYPDRLAKNRGQPGKFHLANGRGAELDPADPLADAPFLVVADMTGRAATARILCAAALTEDDLLGFAGTRITEQFVLEFDASVQAVRARKQVRLEALTLLSHPAPIPDDADVVGPLCQGIAQVGCHGLPWTKAQRQLLARARFFAPHANALTHSGTRADTAAQAQAAAGNRPDHLDLSERALNATVADWLGPYIAGKSAIKQITPSDLDAALAALIPWSLRQHLDQMLPEQFLAPSGQRHAIVYEAETEGDPVPFVALRVQEMFGTRAHPALAEGRIPLSLVLLSPAGRPLQVTQDLPGFWAGSWRDVAAQMRGRYPRHSWPDDPAAAAPTARAKPRRR